MRTFTILSLLLAASVPALADEAKVPKEVSDMFPVGEEFCYAATFAKPDLKPGQTLTEFQVYRLYDPHAELEQVELPREEAIAVEKSMENATSQWVSVFARFNDSPHLYYAAPSCSLYEESGAGNVTCSVDCDGGQFMARKSATGFDLSFNREYGGLRLSASCDGPSDIGIHDRTMNAEEAGYSFSMKRTDIAACKAADNELHDRLIKEKVSLRERIEKQGWRCLKRNYDKAHLAKHPNQKVTSIAVALKGPAIVDKSDGWPATKLETTMSMKLRDGTEVSKDTSCYAGDYSFSCEGNVELMRRDAKTAILMAGQYDDLNVMHQVLDTELGKDDVEFWLNGSTDADCAAE